MLNGNAEPINNEIFQLDCVIDLVDLSDVVQHAPVPASLLHVRWLHARELPGSKCKNNIVPVRDEQAIPECVTLQQ